MAIERVYLVEARGVGRPDYSEKIAIGRIRPGISLEWGQRLKVFGVTFSTIVSPLPYIFPPLGGGITSPIFDWETGLPLPYTVPAGYTYSIFQVGWGFTQNADMPAYVDGIFTNQAVTASARMPYIFTGIAEFSTTLFDPAGVLPHDINLTIRNLSVNNMEGTCSIWGILEAVGTPPFPKIKTIRCKNCSYEKVVQINTTEMKCPKCEFANKYLDLSELKKF